MSSENTLNFGVTENKSKFVVDLGQFSGPYEVLLSLITSRELDISDIALSNITDEFIDYTDKLGAELDINIVSEFIYTASVLLRLKTSVLLREPNSDVSLEDFELLRERDLLFARLMQYKAFKEAAFDIKKMMDGALISYPHPGNADDFDIQQEFSLGVDVKTFESIAIEIFTNLKVSVEHLHIQHVDIEHERKVTLSAIKRKKKLTFRELIKDAESVQVMLVRFLILLEMYKDSLIDFDQKRQFADFTIIYTS
ncbi:MAG: segregation/condensation protein A [Bifidobacteriaceae bacterium]|jgi:segregation and condensation protein A|nr:segregation/condensation protein A [Bifidobacteriaceae bacterium]